MVNDIFSIPNAELIEAGKTEIEIGNETTGPASGMVSFIACINVCAFDEATEKKIRKERKNFFMKLLIKKQKLYSGIRAVN